MNDLIKILNSNNQNVLLDNFYGAPVIPVQDRPDSIEYFIHNLLPKENKYSHPYLISFEDNIFNKTRLLRWNNGFLPVVAKDAYDALIYFPTAQLGIKSNK